MPVVGERLAMDQVAAHVADERLPPHFGRKRIAAITGHAGGPGEIAARPTAPFDAAQSRLAIRMRVRTIRQGSTGLVRNTSARRAIGRDAPPRRRRRQRTDCGRRSDLRTSPSAM